MSEKKLRQQITRFIILSNPTILIIVCVLYSMKGLDLEELNTIVSLLLPITGVYIGAVIKYALANKYEDSKNDDKKVSNIYKMVTYGVTSLHFFILFFAILAYALFNAFKFEILKSLFIAVEGFFGAYIGLIVASIFKVKEEATEEKISE